MKKLITPCTGGCPVNTDIPGYISAIINGDYVEAYQIIRERNPFPSVCAWVCPHPCEDNCRRARVDEPVNIRALKRFAVERGSEIEVKQKDITFNVGDKNLPGGDVAVIGAGPSGLTAAYDLARQGFSVTVLDRYSRPGGHFFASLPLYRLPREVLYRDVLVLQESGLDIRCGVEVGKDITLEELRRKYRSVILAAGLQKSKMLPISGGEHPAVLAALPFLQGANLGNPVSIGRRVIVVGGGDVAMDVARTALRQGASEVTVVCVEAREEMPAHEWEVREAREEGVAFFTRWGPKEVIIEDEGKIKGLKVQRVTRVFDENGRFSPQFDGNVTEFMPADNIILAVGQAASLDFVKGYLEVDTRGNVVVDRETLATSAEGVFACGEVANGPGPAISAVASGHKVAERVAAYLTGKQLPEKEEVEVIGQLPFEVAEHVISRGRENLFQIVPEVRVRNFEAFEVGYSEKQALAEAGRCLRCGLGAEVDISRCAGCLTCQRVCPFGVPAVESRAKISPDACQACGICAAACPAGAITILGLKKDHWSKNGQPGSPPLKIYVCRRVLGSEIVPGFEKEIQEFFCLDLKVLPCAGALRKDWVLRDFEQGACGVALVSCGDGCTRDGISKCRDVEFNAAYRLCSKIGIDVGRLAYLSQKNSGSLLQELSGFARKVARMGPLWKNL